MTDAIIAGAVLAAMAAIAVHDARRALVDPRAVLALLGAAAAWRFLGDGAEDARLWARFADGVLGASLGVAAAMVPIGMAAWLGRRWPLYPGDAMMLGALGFLLGVWGLAWTMLLGSGFALAHRFCVQRRRGRPFRKGLVPLSPGMCAAAAVVFLCLDCGVVLAGDRAGAGDTVRLPAAELAPVSAALPPSLSARQVEVEGTGPLPFPALVRRLAGLAGVAMTIEERPARIAGGEAALDDPPPLDLAWQGSLAGLLDRVASLSGYDWSWQTRGPEDGAVVFFRYWDVEHRGRIGAEGPQPHAAMPAGPVPAAASAANAMPAAAAGGSWTVDPEGHGTLRGVLEGWAAHAGWTVVWRAERDYGLGAAAVFEGGFLEAADLLLSGPATKRTLVARAYLANRHLVVDDADGTGR